jgi:hypothetical protein
MSNKPVKHTDFDNAIKCSLLKIEAKANLDWKDVENLIGKKIPTSDSVPGFSFSMNSFSMAVSLSSVSNFIKSNLLSVKKLSNAAYVLAATIAFIVGVFYLFGKISEHSSRLHEASKITSKDLALPAVPLREQKNISKKENTPVEGNNTSVTAIKTPAVSVTENQNSEKATLIKTVIADVKKPIEKETQFKTVDSSPVVNKTDADSTSEAKANEIPNAKVLYYKESLSLDKLEEELSKETKDSIK